MKLSYDIKIADIHDRDWKRDRLHVRLIPLFESLFLFNIAYITMGALKKKVQFGQYSVAGVPNIQDELDG